MNIELLDDSLCIEHTVAATAEKVFRCFTDDEIAARWMAPGAMECVEMQMDVVVGGAYRLTMQDSDNNRFTSTGTYSEVVPNRRLAYTWQWTHDDSPPTLVEIDLEDTEAGCRVLLRQRGFASADETISHTEGWSRIMKNLESIVAAV